VGEKICLAPFLFHQCVMGKGIALVIRHNFPEAYHADTDTCQSVLAWLVGIGKSFLLSSMKNLKEKIIPVWSCLLDQARLEMQYFVD